MSETTDRPAVAIPPGVGRVKVAAGEAMPKGSEQRVPLPVAAIGKLGLVEGSRVLAVSHAGAYWVAAVEATVLKFGQVFSQKGEDVRYVYICVDESREFVARPGGRDRRFEAAKKILEESGDRDAAWAAYTSEPA